MFNEWDALWQLVLALALSSAIGFERELRQKSAGLRTYTLVGVGSALFMLISKYGFADVVNGTTVVLDPSRVAAQIVSGIGFIGAGLIFVRRDAVRGLTTAAGIWLTAAVGAAAAADLPILATATTAAYFVVAYAYPWLLSRLTSGRGPTAVRVTYEDGQGILREVMTTCTRGGFAIADVAVDRPEGGAHDRDLVRVLLELRGSNPVTELAAKISDVVGVHEVHAGVAHEMFD
ncbi:MgtC/SapB family protein [Conexibacter sp. CPCC 206217]|uniref:MgtC/SapB family protein n=1 Tax=Conexibacter sp. CPCC 206217 TaxID=3064574 RepID=UPI00271867AA|nr:MgtC/SapB family protein [Conexibacter sp. CPCC 206217]MDO8212612.1 MgtC/SapB family protein [Conexibacter sp. CPCC 206217]